MHKVQFRAKCALGRRSCLVGAGLVAVAGVTVPAGAATWDANGGTGGDWFTAASWNPDVVPTADDAVDINANSSAANPVVIDNPLEAAAAASITMAYTGSNTAYLAIRTDLDVAGLFAVGRKGTEAIVNHESGDVTAGQFIIGYNGGPTASYNMTGGTLTTAGKFEVGRGDSGGVIRFNQMGGTVILEDGLSMGSGPYTGGSQQYNLSGGTLIVNGTASLLGWKSAGNEFNHSGGTATFNAAVHFANDFNDPGKLTVRFSDSAQFTANALVDVGSSGGGGEAWIILDGSKTGSGTDVRVVGHDVQFNALSHLEAVIDDAAILNSGDMRKFDVDGTATFAAGSLLNVSFDSAAAPGTWTLLRATTLIDNGLAFDPAVDTSQWSFSTANNELTVTYIPEPAGLALVGLAASLLVARRRRTIA